MNAADIDLRSLLKRLHLPTIARLVADLEPRAASEGWSHRDFLAVLCAEEVANRNNTRIQKAVRNARFPYLKTIDEFDFTFQTTLRRDVLGPYLGHEFVTEGRNLILSGKPGRGKTHLAIAIAYRAIQNGCDARFVTATDLIDDLVQEATNGRLRDATARYLDPDVLIIDEVGYLQHAVDAANVLYGVVDGRCHRRRPVVFTTNKPLSEWGRVLHDDHLAEAVLDPGELLERGRHVTPGGGSFRTRGVDIAQRAVSGSDTVVTESGNSDAPPRAPRSGKPEKSANLKP